MTEAYNVDCMEYMRGLPDGAFDLVVADPPYNVGKASWDKWPSVDAYISDCSGWLAEFSRVTKPTGSVFMFHSDFDQLSRIAEAARAIPGLAFVDFVVLYKRNFRAKAYKTRECAEATGLRSFFPVCEYLLHWFATPGTSATWDATGRERIYSNPECFASLKLWYRAEVERLGLARADIRAAYMTATGRGDDMLRHYFVDSQFEIPTREVWDAVYKPLGFGREYEDLRREYEDLRREYGGLRNYHKCDDEHCNVWECGNTLFVDKDGAFHPTCKPASLYSRILSTSCPPGGKVFDPFLGSGSSRIAAYDLGFDFVGCELDPDYFAAQEVRFARHAAQIRLEGF